MYTMRYVPYCTVSEKVWSRAEVTGGRYTPVPLADHFPDVRHVPDAAPTRTPVHDDETGHAAGDERYWSDDDDMSQNVGPDT